MVEHDFSVQRAAKIDLHHVAPEQRSLVQRLQCVFGQVLVRRPMAKQLHASWQQHPGMRKSCSG
jgi:hypothetical protein